MSDDILGGFVLDAAALAELGGGPNIYAATWAARTAERGIVLLVPAAALSEAWQILRLVGAAHVDQMRDVLASPMVVIDVLDDQAAADTGLIVEGQYIQGQHPRPDVMAAHVAVCARRRGWPCLAGAPERIRAVDPSLSVETLPGMA